MMRSFSYTVLISVFLFLFSCQSKQKDEGIVDYQNPEVRDDGRTIVFNDEKIFSLFDIEVLHRKDETASLEAPAKLVANVYGADGGSDNMVLFNDQELSTHYTALRQNRIDISRLQKVVMKQKEVNLKRLKDLHKLGSATGEEVLNAETELAVAQSELRNLKAGLTEHKIQLKTAGFIPEKLQHAHPGTAYVVGQVPESQIGTIFKGPQTCRLVFTAYPQDTIIGELKGIADRIDSETRMMKIRISFDNAPGKFKTGMFAQVYFNQSKTNVLSLPQSALVTVKGKHYVFVKTQDETFHRIQIQIGTRIGDRIIVRSGLKENQEVVVGGVMQLKGLSFGY